VEESANHSGRHGVPKAPRRRPWNGEMPAKRGLGWQAVYPGLAKAQEIVDPIVPPQGRGFLSPKGLGLERPPGPAEAFGKDPIHSDPLPTVVTIPHDDPEFPTRGKDPPPLRAVFDGDLPGVPSG